MKFAAETALAITSERAADRCRLPSLWWLVGEVTSLSPHLCPRAPARAAAEVLCLEGHRLPSRTGSEIPGEQIAMGLIKGKRQGRGPGRRSDNQAERSPPPRRAVGGRREAEIVFLKECKHVDAE